MLKCIELDERLKAMDQEITVNPQFVQKVSRAPSLTRRGLDGDERAFRMRNVNVISGEMFNCQKFLKIFITKFTERLLRAFSTYGLEVCVGGCVGRCVGGPGIACSSLYTEIIVHKAIGGPSSRRPGGAWGWWKRLTRANVTTYTASLSYRAWDHKKMIPETNHPVTLETNGHPE